MQPAPAPSPDDYHGHDNDSDHCELTDEALAYKSAARGKAAAAELEMRLAATNVFKRDEGGAWKVVMHQAGPCS